jgi:hypothetical protein
MEKISSFLYKVTPILVTVEPEKTFHLLATKTTTSVVECLPTVLHFIRTQNNRNNNNIHSVKGSTKQKTKPPVSLSASQPIPHFFALHFFEEVLARNGLYLDHPVEVEEDNLKNCIDVDTLAMNPLEPIVIHTYVSLLAQNHATYSAAVRHKLINVLKVLDLLQLNGLISTVTTSMPVSLQQQHQQQQQPPATSSLMDIDAYFLLRQCRMFGCEMASIYALLLAHDRVEAVKVAMHVDVLLAKQIAGRAESTDERRALWLEIAAFVVAHEDDMKKAVSLIRESKNTLTIEVCFVCFACNFVGLRLVVYFYIYVFTSFFCNCLFPVYLFFRFFKNTYCRVFVCTGLVTIAAGFH